MPCADDDSTAATDRPDPPWPPRVGELLPRASEAFGVRDKLATYSLAPISEDGWPKVRGFQRILGITTQDIDYLEGAILTGILLVPVRSIRLNPPWGINCVVTFPVRGRGGKGERVVNLRTAWEIVDSAAPPRLTTAFLKP